MKNKLFAEKENIIGNIKKDTFLKKQLETIKKAANEFISLKINSLSFSDFQTFYVTGSRKEYEYEYFKHRKILNTFAVMAAVYEDEEYIKYLQDAVWAILDEFTWALPAHIENGSDIYSCKTWIDLFAAETAFALSEILFIFKDRIEPIVAERIEYEVRQRVINPYLSGKKNSWDSLENNWSAVCAGSVGSAFLYLANEDEIKKILPRIKNTLTCYLNGFGNDGACVEGANYWIYGFGYFTYFAQLLYQYTDGKENLLSSEKVKNIALFQQKIWLRDNKSISFSDCGDLFFHRSGLSHFLKKKYKEFILPDDSCALRFDGDDCYRFAHIIRDFAWRDNNLEMKSESEYGVEYFKDAEWYIKKTKQYEFAAKAGNNNESHNHNDIASFMINAGGKSIITDPGRGEYTADYFSDKRYEYFAPSALAHSVPIINGNAQVSGEERKGTIKEANNNSLIIDFKNAYDDMGLDKLTRLFEFFDKKIIITDSIMFCGGCNGITEHFVTGEKPYLSKNGLMIGGVCVKYDTEKMVCEIYEKIFASGYNQNKTVYITDFKILNPKSENEIKFEFIFNE